jgi:hypothetical protein
MNVIPILQYSGLVLRNPHRDYQKAECSVATTCQLSAMADHECLMTEKRAKVIAFFAKAKKVPAPQR